MRNLIIFLTAIFLVYGCDNGVSNTAKDDFKWDMTTSGAFVGLGVKF